MGRNPRGGGGILAIGITCEHISVGSVSLRRGRGIYVLAATESCPNNIIQKLCLPTSMETHSNLWLHRKPTSHKDLI